VNPHAAFYTLESEEEARRKAVENVIIWARDGRPPNVVARGNENRKK
jgi:lactate dehydrogenase-like 2-hydroxyacid dehydrogenase